MFIIGRKSSKKREELSRGIAYIQDVMLAILPHQDVEQIFDTITPPDAELAL